MVIITVIVISLIFILNIKVNDKDLKVFKKYKIVRKVCGLSFSSLKSKFDIIGINYTNQKYFINALLLSLVLGVIFYITIQSLLYTTILLSICIFLFPYIQYLNYKSQYDEYIESDIFSYTQSAIIFLKEEKTVYNILKECINNVSGPLKNDLINAVKHIDQSSDFVFALKEIEDKYQHTCIKNLHILLIGKLKYGTINSNLYDFLYHDIEEYELMISNFKLKKSANQKAFYFMMLLDLCAVYIVKSMFNDTQMLTADTNTKLVIFVFYIMNIGTIYFYEIYCNKMNNLNLRRN